MHARQIGILGFVIFCALSACNMGPAERPAQAEWTASLIWIVCEDESLFSLNMEIAQRIPLI